MLRTPTVIHLRGFAFFDSPKLQIDHRSALSVVVAAGPQYSRRSGRVSCVRARVSQGECCCASHMVLAAASSLPLQTLRDGAGTKQIYSLRERNRAPFVQGFRRLPRSAGLPRQIG
jgi:hypothetical protein